MESREIDVTLRRSSRKGVPLRMLEIRYVPTPEADERVRAAMHILLRTSGAQYSTPEENSNSEAST